MLEIAAGICRDRSGRVLICQRGPGGECGFLWEFPGGKVEDGETFEDCLKRECREELEVGVAVGTCVGEVIYPYQSRTVHIRFFNMAVIEGEPKLNVHEAMVWEDVERLSHYEFCPADVRIVENLQKGCLPTPSQSEEDPGPEVSGN